MTMTDATHTATLHEWVEAALAVADSNGMDDSQVIPTWPEDLADQFPALTVGALRQWARQCARADTDEPAGNTDHRRREWIPCSERLPEVFQFCDWLFPQSALKNERRLLIGEAMATASVPGEATHWREHDPEDWPEGSRAHEADE